MLWDKNDLTRARAIQYGAPAWRVMEDEFGDGRVARVEVWSLRQPTEVAVSPAEAGSAMSDIARIVHRHVR